MMHDLPEPVRYEPVSALLAGPTGLELYVRLFEQVTMRGWDMPLVIEIDAREADAIKRLASSRFPKGQIRILPDYAGLPRVVTIEPCR
jgi:methylase of polypeptide subunit release factors